MTRLAITLSLVLLFARSVNGAFVFKALSASYTDVSNAVAQAYVSGIGNIISIPAGTASWTAQLILTNVHLVGAGTNLTILQHDTPSRGAIIKILANTAGPSSVSHLQITYGTVTGAASFGVLSVQGDCTGTAYRLHHLFVNQPYEGYGLFPNNIKGYGLIDHVTCVMRTACHPVTVQDYSYGDSSWNTADDHGSTNKVYVEDSTFIAASAPIGGQLQAPGADHFAGARTVFRFNTFSNCNWVAHGTETSGRSRSGRSYEVYGNTFTASSPAGNASMVIRGGTGLFYSNTVVNMGAIQLQHYRATVGNFTFGGAYGGNPWDTNSSTTFFSGTHTGASGITNFISAGAGWTSDQWRGYTCTNATTGKFGLIISNTVDQLYFLGAANQNPLNLQDCIFTNGQTGVIRFVQQAIDCPGAGAGDLLTGDVPTPVWLNQAVSPIYEWANTLNGGDCDIGNGGYVNLPEGKFYTNDTVFAYTALSYPHPLNLSVSISPAAAVAAPAQVIDFDGAGGTGSFVAYELTINASGATINPTTGLYTAGPGTGSDLVRVWDSFGNFADAPVTVSGDTRGRGRSILLLR